MHRRLLALTRDVRLPLLLTILSGILAGLLTIWQAWLLSSAVSEVFLGGAALAQVKGPLALMLIAIGGRTLLAWMNEILANSVAVKIKTDLRQRLFAHILDLGPAYSRGQRSGELTTAAVEGIEALDAYFSQYLPQLVITALVPISILVFVFPIDLLSGLVFLMTAPLIPFFMIMIGKGAESVTKRQYETLRLLGAHFLDSLQGLTTLKLFGQSKAQTRSIARVSDQFRDTTLSVLRITFLSALALELLATLSTAIIAVEIGFRLLYASMEFQPALFLLVLAPEFYLPLRALGARFHAGMSGTSAAKRIFEILDMEVDRQGMRYGRSAMPGITSLQLSDITYTYPGESTPALARINLQIHSGQHIALVGPSGAGKTTLISLLLRFMDPTGGSISINQIPSTSIPLNSWRESVAWVPQKPYLFHDTLAANLRLGKPAASREQLVDAARSAHLDDFIESLPEKYETVIGEGGARLSSGQAQRLAIARAFVKNAPILILDEPTSSLDPETESLLEESTRRLMHGRTVIIIAHRINTIFQADQIVVIRSGCIAEQGTHRELMDQNGLYAAMLNTKMLRVESEAVKVAPPDSGSTTNSESQSNTLNLHPSTGPAPGISNRKSPILLRLLSFLRGTWQRVALSVLLGSLTIGSSIALMGTSAWLISTAALHPSIADLGVSVVGVRFFGIARGLFRYCERLVSHDVTFRLLSRLRVWFFDKLEPLAPARLMEFRAGDLLARIVSDVETLENFYVRVAAPPVTAVIVGLISSIFLAAYHPALVPVYLSFFLILGLILPMLTQVLSRRSAEQIITLRARLHTHLVDGIQGISDLLAFGRTAEHLALLSARGTEYGDAQRRMARRTGLHSGLSTLLAHLGLWTILVFCIPLVTDGILSGPMLPALTLLTFASFEAVTPLPLAAQMWNASREAARRLFEIVDAEPFVGEGGEIKPDLDSRPALPALEISNLSFTYPNSNTPAIGHISFRIRPGQSLAIVGPSGAGKSTLANILLRFWDYISGDIRLDDESLKSYTQDQVRARIGLVSQNTYFFNTSIRENLRFARRRVSDEEIQSASKAAQIHDFIAGLAKGYDTVIGEQGLRLSGGERQRLAIARVLIKNPPLLILDEPTANLDPLTENHVLGTLFGIMKQRTSLLITHRLIGLENVDEILVLDHGQIVERGSHIGLLKSDGLYRRLFDLQNRMLDSEP